MLVIACGALAHELLAIKRVNALDDLVIECLPARLHNRPEKIPEAVRGRIQRGRRDHDRIFVGYADCGTGGMLDRVLDEEGVERLPGAHCYEFFAGASVFANMHGAEPGTLYLTDYLVRHFDRLIISGLGLDRHPELHADYFGNYSRLIYLAQVEDPALVAKARAAADRLGLAFERRFTGFGGLESSLLEVV